MQRTAALVARDGGLIVGREYHTVARVAYDSAHLEPFTEYEEGISGQIEIRSHPHPVWPGNNAHSMLVNV